MKEELAEKFKIIEAVLFDVDGVMTDGKIYCSESHGRFVFNLQSDTRISLSFVFFDQN